MFDKIGDKYRNLIVLHGHYDPSDNGSKFIQAVKLNISKFSLNIWRKKIVVNSDNGNNDDDKSVEFLVTIEVVSLSGRSWGEILLIVDCRRTRVD